MRGLELLRPGLPRRGPRGHEEGVHRPHGRLWPKAGNAGKIQVKTCEEMAAFYRAKG